MIDIAPAERVQLMTEQSLVAREAEGGAVPTAVHPVPPQLPTDAEILGRAGGENFTVASRLVPGPVRGHLLAFYGYARLIDQLGDDYPGDRLAALDWASAEVGAAMIDPDAPGRHSLIAAAARSALALGTGSTPLLELIEANRVDQTTSAYRTWDDLLGYCRLSADPVGRLVLAAFEVATPGRQALSDDVCSALQVVEHLQDVAEDALAGRVYLPADDLERFGVGDGELLALARSGRPAPPRVRALVAFEAWRTRRLLDRGSALVGTLRGSARAAVAGFVAGGYGALDAVAVNGYDPFTGSTKPSPWRVASQFSRLVRRGGSAADR
jgi:squalene synthase HpnC